MQVYKPYSTWDRKPPKADDLRDVVSVLGGVFVGIALFIVWALV